MSASFRIATAVALAMAATGCFIGDPYVPPPPPPDGSGITGLSITWEPRPVAIPGPAGTDITIDRAVFHQDDLRLLGEAGTFQLERDRLEWASGIAPAVLPVMGAAPGLYAKLSFELEGDEEDMEYAYQITGSVVVNGVTRRFTIRDTASFQLALDFSIELAAGGTVMIPVRVEVDRLVSAVDFRQLQLVNGEYLVDRTVSQISEVREAVPNAFGVHGLQ